MRQAPREGRWLLPISARKRCPLFYAGILAVRRVTGSGSQRGTGHGLTGLCPAVTRPHFSTQSAHFGTSVLAPHGMIGTDEVEFLGEPSIRRSE